MKLIIALAFLVCSGPLAAQPVLQEGPFNAGSYIPAGRPNSGIAQGSVFILYGQNIGPATIALSSGFPLSTNLGGSEVRVTVGGTTITCIGVYSLSSAVAVVLPSQTPTGVGTVTLTRNSVTTNSLPIRVVANAFGMFTRNSAGKQLFKTS